MSCKVQVPCKGRDAEGGEPLEKPVEATVAVSQYPGSAMISLDVSCEFNAGGHGQRCTASHPGEPKVGDGVGCPYAVDLPHAMDCHAAERRERAAAAAAAVPAESSEADDAPDDSDK